MVSCPLSLMPATVQPAVLLLKPAQSPALVDAHPPEPRLPALQWENAAGKIPYQRIPRRSAHPRPPPWDPDDLLPFGPSAAEWTTLEDGNRRRPDCRLAGRSHCPANRPWHVPCMQIVLTYQNINPRLSMLRSGAYGRSRLIERKSSWVLILTNSNCIGISTHRPVPMHGGAWSQKIPSLVRTKRSLS